MYSSALAQSHISVYSSTYTIQSKRWTSHLWHNQLLHPLKKRTSPSSSYSDYSLHYSLGQGILAQSKFYHGFCKKAESCYDYVVSNSPTNIAARKLNRMSCSLRFRVALNLLCSTYLSQKKKNAMWLNCWLYWHLMIRPANELIYIHRWCGNSAERILNLAHELELQAGACNLNGVESMAEASACASTRQRQGIPASQVPGERRCQARKNGIRRLSGEPQRDTPSARHRCGLREQLLPCAEVRLGLSWYA